MKRILSLILSLSLASFMLISMNAAPSANLVLNPSFNGNFDNWYLSDGDLLEYNALVSFNGIGGSAQVTPTFYVIYSVALCQDFNYSNGYTYYCLARIMVNNSLGSSGFFCLDLMKQQ